MFWHLTLLSQQFVKCGYAGSSGSNFPLYTFPSLVGRPIIRAAQRIDDIEVRVSHLFCQLLCFALYLYLASCCLLICNVSSAQFLFQSLAVGVGLSVFRPTSFSWSFSCPSSVYLWVYRQHQRLQDLDLNCSVRIAALLYFLFGFHVLFAGYGSYCLSHTLIDCL